MKLQMYRIKSLYDNSTGYRGEIKFKFAVTEGHQWAKLYNLGDRIGQLIILPYPQIEFEEVEELSTTVRGEGGFGSSGK
jgi:dUTP pyrophosphatase